MIAIGGWQKGDSMSDWANQGFFWIAVVSPALVTIWALISTWPKPATEFRRWFFSTAPTSLVAVPPVQPYLHMIKQQELANVYAVPVFLIVYLVWGRFEVPSIPIAYAGTFLSLLIADFAGAWFAAATTSARPFFAFVGGGGLWDGLFLIPIATGLVTAMTKKVLKNGHNLSFLIGRKMFMSALSNPTK
jgi:hypothetical protein